MDLSGYWQTTAAAVPRPALDGDTRCDVCIVGAGYTGLWAACFLAEAEPSATIVVIDAGTAAGGASGTNGGFVQMNGGKVLRRMIWYYGRAKAAGAYRAVARSTLEIGRFCRQNGIDAQFESNGFLQVVTDAKQMARLALQAKRAERAGMGRAFTLYGAREARERFGSPLVRGAMRASGALVNPYRLGLGLAQVADRRGVRVLEHTPASAVTKDGTGFRVTTPHGEISAGEVVIATNAWQNSFPDLYLRQMPMWHYYLVTEPLTETQMSALAWPGREGVADARSLGNAMRLTPDNRVLFAGGPWHFRGRDVTADPADDGTAHRALRESFDRFFPMLRDVRAEFTDGGPISWSHSFIPQFGRTDNGLVYGHGYTGSGIAASHTGGQIIRDLVLRRKTELTDLAFVTATQPKFLPGAVGIRMIDLFLWRQRVGDRLPLVLPHPAVIAPERFFAKRAVPSRPVRPRTTAGARSAGTEPDA